VVKLFVDDQKPDLGLCLVILERLVDLVYLHVDDRTLLGADQNSLVDIHQQGIPLGAEPFLQFDY
jgi:hypothetical protein